MTDERKLEVEQVIQAYFNATLKALVVLGIENDEILETLDIIILKFVEAKRTIVKSLPELKKQLGE